MRYHFHYGKILRLRHFPSPNTIDFLPGIGKRIGMVVKYIPNDPTNQQGEANGTKHDRKPSLLPVLQTPFRATEKIWFYNIITLLHPRISSHKEHTFSPICHPDAVHWYRRTSHPLFRAFKLQRPWPFANSPPESGRFLSSPPRSNE